MSRLYFHTSTLTITLPTIGLLNLSGYSSFGGDVHATVLEMLQDNIDSNMYRVDLNNGHQAVCKSTFSHASCADLKNEVDVYTNVLPHLQGTVALRFYGFYSGLDETGRDVGCMLAEDCPGDVGCKLTELPLHDRLEVVKQMGRMHQAGLQPTIDLGGANITRAYDGSFRIAHFQDLQQHECEWDGNWHLDEGTPQLSDIKCETLFEFGRQMGIWKPYKFPLVYVGGEAYLDFGDQMTTVSTEVVEEPKS